MKKFIWISEPKMEAFKYRAKVFLDKDYVSLFIKANILLYFIYYVEKILGKYL